MFTHVLRVLIVIGFGVFANHGGTGQNGPVIPGDFGGP